MEKIQSNSFGRDLLGFRDDVNKLADSLFVKAKRSQFATPKKKIV